MNQMPHERKSIPEKTNIGLLTPGLPLRLVVVTLYRVHFIVSLAHECFAQANKVRKYDYEH